ncbi:MAG: hypothetical protein J6T22_03175 [Bacteroidales bacterium]|nr:hypothetical protein [Bacteroidales bacterium]
MERIEIHTDKMIPFVEYVCWLDIMGTQNSMSESFEKSANFILRFHTAVLKAAISQKVRVYPVMDGVYVVVKKLDEMRATLDKIMTSLAEVFLAEKNNHRFVVRGALARGPIQHGSKISSEISADISPRVGYKQHLLFGMPMIQAFTSEKLAPPFGIYIHESARTVGGLQGRYYYWRRNEALSANVHLQSELKEGLISFFGWEKDRSFYYKLEKTKFEEYEKRVEEYYRMIEEGIS